MPNYNSLLFGTDPEYFVVEKEDEKDFAVPVPHFLSNIGVPEIGHDKTFKHPVIAKVQDFKIMMDGVAFEANPSPSKNAKEMFEKISSVLNWLGDFSGKYGYALNTKPTVYYNYRKWFDPENPWFAWCGIFGCDADEDAIFPEYNSPILDVENHPYRYGGGHFHISDGNQIIDKNPRIMIWLLALTQGNFSIVSSPYPEEEKLRMFKYGQPGRFRVQKYPDGITGVEYRSPSNCWTTDLATVEGMIYWATKAWEILQNPERAKTLAKEYLPLTIEAIQEVNKEKASYVLEKL